MSRFATTASEFVVVGAPASCRRASMAAEACRAGNMIQFDVVMLKVQVDEGFGAGGAAAREENRGGGD